MNKIKMSDLVELPIDYKDMLIDSDIAEDDSEQGFNELAAEAINVYDANQESISNLRITVHNLATDGLKQDKRITELEAALQEVIYHFESGNGDHSDLNDGMIPKLKELAIKGGNNETT